MRAPRFSYLLLSLSSPFLRGYEYSTSYLYNFSLEITAPHPRPPLNTPSEALFFGFNFQAHFFVLALSFPCKLKEDPFPLFFPPRSSSFPRQYYPRLYLTFFFSQSPPPTVGRPSSSSSETSSFLNSASIPGAKRRFLQIIKAFAPLYRPKCAPFPALMKRLFPSWI